MFWSRWHAWFDANRHRAYPDPTDLPALSPDARAALGVTIATLQAGETGEGRVVSQVVRADLGDADYHECIALFIAEEGTHAKLMGQARRALDTAAPEAPWSAEVFAGARNLIDVEVKLMILLAAECVAGPFYDHLARALPDSGLADTLARIRDDEDVHRVFHATWFRSRFRGVRAAAWRAAWWPCALSACAVVLADHAATLRRLGISRRALFRDMRARIRQTDADVRGHHALAPPAVAEPVRLAG